MSRTTLASFALLLTLPPAVAQTPPVRYLDIGFMETGIFDLKYGRNLNPWTNQWEDLLLDMYVPVGDTASARAVYIHVHGGQFYYGTKRNGEALMFCKDLTYRGWVTISIDYRLATGPDHRGWGPDIVAEDAKAAVRWVRANAQKYRLDPNRIVLGGDSVGAGTSIIAAYTSWPGSSGNPGYSHVPNAVFNMWGWHGATIATPSCSIYSVHGKLDHATPYQVAVGIHQEAVRNGVFSGLQLLENVGHSPFQEWPAFRTPMLSFMFEAMYLHELAGIGAVDGYSAGKPLTMHVSGWQGDVAHLFAGVALPSPIHVPEFGSWWLDPYRVLPLGALSFTAQETRTRTVTFPVPAELRGAAIDWQAIYVPKAGRIGMFSNAVTTQF